MRYFPRYDVYRSSNCIYRVKTREADSYGWWCFVKIIDGQTVFNSYRYSVTTAKHQRDVRSIMRDLGHTIDLTVQVADGLQKVTTMEELQALNETTLRMLADAAEAKRIERNRKARIRRAERKLSAMGAEREVELASNPVWTPNVGGLRLVR